MKVLALALFLLPALAHASSKTVPNPADYTLTMQVQCSTWTARGQVVGGLLNGKPIEMMSTDGTVTVPLEPGDYKVKQIGPAKYVPATVHDINMEYEFLFSDLTLRLYSVIGIGTTGCGGIQQ